MLTLKIILSSQVAFTYATSCHSAQAQYQGSCCGLSVEESMTTQVLPNKTAFTQFTASLHAALSNAKNIPVDPSNPNVTWQMALGNDPVTRANCAFVRTGTGEHFYEFGTASPGDRYFAASLSKVLSAGIINKLHDDGVLDMYAPMSTYAPSGWANLKYPNASLMHMISNTAGIPGIFDFSITPPQFTDTVVGPHSCMSDASTTLQECGRTIATVDVPDTVAPPGMVFQYGGGQWQLAGALAEIMSGKSWTQLFKETYVDPCGLTSSSFDHGFQSQLTGGLFVAYPTEDAPAPDSAPQSNPSIEGGLVTSVEDYTKILTMYLRGGVCRENTRVHPMSTIVRMTTDHIQDMVGPSGRLSTYPISTFGFGEGYGLGWWASRTTPGVVECPGIFGSTPFLDVRRGVAGVCMVATNNYIGVGLYPQIRSAVQTLADALWT